MAFLITEQDFDCVKPIVEKTDDGQVKNLFIEGTFMQGEVKNRNGRIYPMSILDREAKRYMEQYVSKNRALGELNHPPTPTVDPERASHMTVKMWKEGTNWNGKAKVLSTPMGNIVRGLIGDGVQLGVSTRGLGSLKESKGGKIVQSDFYLATIDMVSDPSAQDAWVNGIFEGREWACPNEEAQEKMMETIDRAVRQGTLNEGAILNQLESFLVNLGGHVDLDESCEVTLAEAKAMKAIGDGLYITKVGFDTNGKWSYWIKDAHNKHARKIQHGNIGQGSAVKITKDDMKNFNIAKVKDTIDGILAYYRKYMTK